MDNNVKIKRVSTLLRTACEAYLVFKPLLVIVIWLNLEQIAGDLNPFPNLPLRMEFIGATNLMLAFLVNCVPMGLMMYGVWRLRALFNLYRGGILFSPAAARHLQLFGAMLLATVLTSPVIDVLTSVALTMNYPAGERMISIDFSNSDLSMLFIAGVMFAIGWIMREGQRIAEENAEFV